MIKLIEGNSLQIMDKFTYQTFDLILTNPPYNISVDGSKINRRGVGKYKEKQILILILVNGSWYSRRSLQKSQS